MSDDYLGTADLMQRDSHCLHNNQYWHNACYLAGYVVECSLKAIAEADGMTQQELSRYPYGHNLTKLEPLVITHARLFTNYQGIPFESARITASQLFSWNPYDRYQPTRWDDENTSQEFQETAEYMFNFLSELYLNGQI
jgi:HEPN domain-containing protein